LQASGQELALHVEHHGPREKYSREVVPLVEFGAKDQRSLEEKTARELIWTSHHSFQGWTCSQCEWNYPLPTLLHDPEARTAYDRLATAKFREHKCADQLRRLAVPDHESFTPRIRKLVSQGFKPRDAVDLFLQEVALEYRNQPKTLARAKEDGEDFLRRVKAGLI
jgi:hypothetical protein